MSYARRRTLKTYAYYALLFELLGMTGLRISEALSLRWIDITDKGIRVMNAKRGRPRILAINPVPGLPELLKRIRAIMDKYAKNPPGARRRHLPADNVFWWIDPTDPRNVFNEAKKVIRLIDDGRTLHTLRGNVEWRWENVLGWDDRTICDFTRHTSRVRQQHYRSMPTAEELETRLRRYHVA